MNKVTFPGSRTLQKTSTFTQKDATNRSLQKKNLCQLCIFFLKMYKHYIQTSAGAWRL